MRGLLLAATWTNYVIIGVVVLLLLVMFIMMNARNKKETQKVQEQTNSLKVGDKVMTTSGVYGTITEIKFDDTRKMVVLETGGKIKSYMSIDAYAIYTVFKSDAELAREAAKAEAEKKEESKAVEEKPAEVAAEPEKPAVKKRTTKAKTETKKK